MSIKRNDIDIINTSRAIIEKYFDTFFIDNWGIYLVNHPPTGGAPVIREISLQKAEGGIADVVAEKLIKNTGWKTLVNINEGLNRTIDYYLKIKITNKINNFINRRGNVE